MIDHLSLAVSDLEKSAAFSVDLRIRVLSDCRQLGIRDVPNLLKVQFVRDVAKPSGVGA